MFHAKFIINYNTNKTFSSTISIIWNFFETFIYTFIMFTIFFEMNSLNNLIHHTQPNIKKNFQSLFFLRREKIDSEKLILFLTNLIWQTNPNKSKLIVITITYTVGAEGHILVGVSETKHKSAYRK